jgi:hypothetical protein
MKHTPDIPTVAREEMTRKEKGLFIALPSSDQTRKCPAYLAFDSASDF